MRDFALAWNPATSSGDWFMDGGDLATESGLRSAVIISLFTDRLANADDVLPDNSGNRRGWWGDAPLPTDDGTTGPAVPIGSRLWLLTRAKAIPETAQDAQAYCLEALQWMLADGIASGIAAQCRWVSRDYLQITVTISRDTVAGAPPSNTQFDLAWQRTLNS